MSMDLAKNTFHCEPEYFIAGTTIPIATAAKQVAEDLPAHTPVILNADGKLAVVSATTTGDGEGAKTEVNTTGLYGLTAESAASGEDAIVYLSGEFFADEMVLPAGMAASDVEIALRNIGIYLR